MAINSWSSPKVTDKISECVPFIQKALTALLKMEPASISDVPTGAKRMTLPNASQWKIEKFDGSNWVAAGKLMHDVDTVDGYHAAITPAKNTLAVRNADGVLQDSITGNAATSTVAAALSQINPLSMGGTGSNTAAGARTNLGVPPIAHASTANTYGLGTDTNYGHLKLSDAVNGTESVSNGTAATPKAVKDANASAVHLAGAEAIAGVKTFTDAPIIQGGSPMLNLVNTDIEKGTPPSDKESGKFIVYDKNGSGSSNNIVGEVSAGYDTAGTCYAQITARTPVAGKNDPVSLILKYPATGYPYATCPTPKDASGNIDTSDNSSKIATTQWVKASSLSLTGGTMTGPVSSSVVTGTFVSGAGGNAIVNSTATSGSYVALVNGKTTNGAMSIATYEDYIGIHYVTNTNISSGTNTVTKSATLLNEAGNTIFPGVVKGATPSATSNTTELATTAWVRSRFKISSSAPSGGGDGDVWFQYV